MSGATEVPAPAGERVVIVFDGVCNLCNGWVDFVIARDHHARFRFAASQSHAGRELLRAAGVAPDAAATSVYVIERHAGGQRVSDRSSACLRILAGLGLPWRLAGALRVVPRPIRDAVYDAIAARRLRWFGTRDACRVPRPEERDRFLGDGSVDGTG